MNKLKLARLISFAFHPAVFILPVPFLVVYKQTTDIVYGVKWFVFSLFFLILVMVLFFLVRPKDFLTDIDISKKEDRHIFYSIATLAAIIYFIVALIFKGAAFPLSIVALGIMLGIVVFDLATYYMKISIHEAVICAFVITFGMLYGIIPFIAVVWLVPLMAWSRVFLKKHTKREVVAGALVGSFITLLTLLIAEVII